MKKQTNDELVFLPLGGSNEIGMNFNLYGYGPAHDRKWIVVDLGVTFGDQTTPGVEIILPDPEYIVPYADDILGIVILAVVVSLAGGGSLEIGPILKLVAAAVVFVVAAIGLSRTAAPAFDWLLDRLKAPGETIVASFVVLTLCCFAATAIGLEAALGAFAAGLILSNSRHSHAIETAVKPVVALFATIFFVLIGTGMDLSVLNPLDPANRAGLVVAGFLLVVAIAGKVAAGWSFLSDQLTNRLVVGLGMMPRGEVGLIFLGLGTQAKLLSPALEAAILLMVIGSTFLAPVLLRLVLAGKTDGPDLDPLAEIPT